MAAVTENLAFGITACTTFEPPFILAKRFSTLDHITNGRIAWVRVHCYITEINSSSKHLLLIADS